MEKVEAKAKKIAAHALEASENDIVIENGEFKVTGTDKSIALPMVALAAYTAHNLPDGMEPGLKEGAFYDPTNFTFPAGAYICELEVDAGTGKTSFVNFVAADDFGRLINPMIVEGQVHGGLAQGIGQALLEGAVVRQFGPAADGVVHGLRHAARRRPAVVQADPHHDAVSGQSARRQGLRRGRRDRRIGRRDQRDHGCDRQQQTRNAGDARSRLARHSRLRGSTNMYETTYHRPSSVDEAVALFGKGSESKYLAGGHTLIPVMKQRLASPSDVIDLGKIKELIGIEASGDTLTIKAATTYFDIMQSADVKKSIPAIAYLTSVLGDPAVRYRGTIGGSIANNDPAADFPAALVSLGATVKTNKRSISADDFFKGLFTTALEDGEIITAVSFPVPAKAGYAKMRHPASRFALTGVFVTKTKAGDVRVAATGASQNGVMRVPAIEAALKANWSAGALDSVKISDSGMLADIHGSAAYRANLVKVMAQRAVTAAG